jgi:hypothetical protein
VKEAMVLIPAVRHISRKIYNYAVSYVELVISSANNNVISEINSEISDRCKIAKNVT